jgi:hypothetical protein
MDDLVQHKQELQDSISRLRHHGNEMHRILERHSEGGTESLMELFETLAGFSDNLRRSILRHRLLMLDVPEKVKAWMTANGCVRPYKGGPWHIGQGKSGSTLCGSKVRFGHSNPDITTRMKSPNEVYFLPRNFVQVPGHTEPLCSQCQAEATILSPWISPATSEEWVGNAILSGARFIVIPPTA